MPKLPANYVKAPSFDNPLRATARPKAEPERSLQLHLDERTWQSLHALCEAAGLAPEDVVVRALTRHLSQPENSAIAPSAAPAPSKRAQLLDQLYEHFVRRSWLQCVLTMRAILREKAA